MNITTAAELAKTGTKGITIRDKANVHGIDATLRAAYEIYPGRFIVRLRFVNGFTTEKVYPANHQFVI